MSDSSFNQIIASVQRQGEHFNAEIPASWMQGRATFGGLVAALLVEAMEQALAEPMPLRGIQVLFVGPVSSDPLHIETKVLRQGRNVTSMRADLVQDGQINCTVTASFGADRASQFDLGLEPRPEMPAPESLSSAPYIEGLMPPFLQYLDLRWAEGAPPRSNCPDRRHGMWARFRDSGPASLAHLIALADFPAPIPLSMTSDSANASSLMWTMEFVDHSWQADMSDWWFLQVDLLKCSGGYANQEYKIWAPNGAPVALARQVMTVFG